MSLRVWAPYAGTVELVMDETRLAMRAGEHGWWSSIDDGPAPGEDYGFSLDGGDRLPDPRGERAPHGVHGPSRRVDHAAFTWTDAEWRPPALSDAVIYELHIGSFSPEGTFDGAIGHLDHLADLGISYVELMPVHAFPGQHGWGYDVAGYFAVHEPYGGPDGLKRLVDACHARGMAVLLDVVYNHMGPEGCYLGRFGPYVTERFQTPWGGAINLGDAGADEVRAFIIDNALMWLRDYHVDGLRIDAVHAFIDLTAVHLLEEMAAATLSLAGELGRPHVLIAESDLNDPRLLFPRDAGGYGLEAQWSDDFHHAVHTTLTGESDGYYVDFDGFDDLVTASRHGWVYRGQHSRHRGRRHGREPTGIALRRLVGFLQNHDQVGNRARGERIGHLAGHRAQAVAAALSLLGPFTPLLFQGEEWAAGAPFLYFTDFGDTELGEAVRDGRRKEFPALAARLDEVPDPQDRKTFEASRIDWSELDGAPHDAMLTWYKRLISLRRTLMPADPGAVPEVRGDAASRVIELDWGSWRVLANMSTSGPARSVTVRGARLAAAMPGVRADDTSRIELPPLSAAIVAVATGVADG